MKFEDILRKNENWIQDKLSINPDYFSNHFKGQEPKILYIGCSDSRVPAEKMMGLKMGDMFVHRNIANLVNRSDLNVLSVLEYALAHLKVEHVIVCGHRGCGGVKAALSNEDLGVLNPWIQEVKNTAQIHCKELEKLDEKDRYERLIELNVLAQCENIKLTQVYQNQVKDRKLDIHPWIFDIETGRIIDLNKNKTK